MGLECVENKFLKLPNIQKYEIVSRTEDGFIASVEMDDGYEFQINACFLNRVFPSTIMKLIDKQDKSRGVSILVAPYISDRTAQICEDNGMGYFDYAGNCWFVGHSIYLSEKGNKNPRPKEQRSVSIFERTSVVSSCILRELFADVTKIWKLKYLSEKVNCSIGQVSKLMKVLVENAWVEKLPDGYKVIDPITFKCNRSLFKFSKRCPRRCRIFFVKGKKISVQISFKTQAAHSRFIIYPKQIIAL